MIRKLGVFLLLGLYYLSLDMVHTRPKGSEDGSLYEGANKGTAHKRGSDRATAIGDRMRAAKAAKRDAEAQAAPVVVNQPSETSQLLLTYRTYFHPVDLLQTQGLADVQPEITLASRACKPARRMIRQFVAFMLLKLLNLSVDLLQMYPRVFPAVLES